MNEERKCRCPVDCVQGWLHKGTHCEGCEKKNIPPCNYWMPAKWPGRDMCAKHPRHEGFGFVRRGEWDDFPPFLFCRDVNGGGCPLFEPKRGEDDAGRE